MAITVKDVNGTEQSIPGNGKTNTALGLAIGALGTSLLSGGLNGFLGNGVVAPAVNGSLTRECLVDKDMFYQTLISQINTQSDRDIQTERRFAGLEAAIAVSNTANTYQNSIVHDRFETEGVINNLNRELAICQATKNMVRGDVFLSPRHLADSYVSPTRVLDSHEAREYLPCRGNNGGCNPYHGGF